MSNNQYTFQSDIKRFMNKVEKINTGCWLWKASIKDGRYGGFQLNNKYIRAHRASFELFKGPIPEGLQVNHTCDIMLCVNPEHLYTGTSKQNTRDKFDRSRFKTKLTLEQTQEIKIKYSEGMYQKEISKIYGVSQSAVSMVISGKRWNWS